MNPHTSKGASTLGVWVSVDSWIFKEQLQGSKFNGVKSSLYHWKFFRTWMSKMGSHGPFGHLKYKLWPREGPRVKLTIWLLTIKSKKSPWFPRDFLMCKWCATYRWKALDEGYKFFSNFISIRGLYAKLQKTQLWEFWDSHLGALGQNVIWMWVSQKGTKYTIRGKVVVSPKSRPWWVLWV